MNNELDNDLIEYFREKDIDINNAIVAMLKEADQIASGEKEAATMDDLFD